MFNLAMMKLEREVAHTNLQYADVHFLVITTFSFIRHEVYTFQVTFHPYTFSNFKASSLTDLKLRCPLGRGPPLLSSLVISIAYALSAGEQ